MNRQWLIKLKSLGWRFNSFIGTVLIILGCTAACMDNSDSKERATVENAQNRMVTNQPPPAYEWSLERHLMINLYNGRNRAVATYTFVRNQFTGKIMSRCQSIGFPIPATTQLTNPMKWIGQGAVINQAEPNGLYAPSSTKATFVMCVENGKVVPRYYEPDVETYLQPMIERDGELIPAPGSVPSLTIDIPKK